MCNHGSLNGRFSWDPLTAMLAIIGDEEKAGYDVVCGTASVNPKNGANSFKVSENGLHKYLVRKFDTDYYKEQINNAIKF